MDRIDQLETGIVEGLASEGQGIIRKEGMVVFVPFTAPGDKISFRITQKKKNFALGTLKDILTPSPLRTTPLCPYFGTCGGCQLQHLRYDAQLSAKRQWIEDALHRLAGLTDILVPAVTPSNLQWSYRRRINLVLKAGKESFQAGYIATDNRTLLPITQCPIFTSPNDPVIGAIQEIANNLNPAGREDARATILKRHQGGYVVHFHFKWMPKNIEEIIAKILPRSPFIHGILASSPKKTFQFGSQDTSMEVAGLQIDFSPKAFIQSHPEQSLNIYHAIEAKAQELQPKSAVDVYCGIGISSLLLAKQKIRVTGVEANAEAVRLAQLNAKKNKIANTNFIAADAGAILESLLAKERPDFVIVNPPREGLSPEVINALIKHPAKSLIYISCMPPTLARDLKRLCLEGYSVSSVQAFDMFPQTIHVETMVTLQK